MWRPRSLVVACAAALAVGCSPAAAAAATAATAAPSDERTCTGIRGNGNLIFAHFGSLARIVEQYGPVRCAAGGSSGSITTFLIESVNRNVVVNRCGKRRCPEARIAARQALLYKSMSGLTAVGIGADVRTVAAILERVQSAGVDEELAAGAPGAVRAFRDVLEDFGDAVNPEVIEALRRTPKPEVVAADVLKGLENAIAFHVEDVAVFVRPSVLNWDVVVRLLGRAGDFYAGYGPTDRAALRGWLRACAGRSRGLSWEQTRALSTPDGTCGRRFARIYRGFEAAYRRVPPVHSRLDDRIGTRLPMIAVTGVLTGSMPAWRAARERYVAGEPLAFSPSFDDVRFGYFGQPRDLKRIQAGLARRYPDDIVRERFLALGPETWRTILGASPAEPGLSAAVPLPRGRLSVGGWADPQRVQVLKALGSGGVITVTRIGADDPGSLTYDAPRLLGASDEQLTRMFSLTDPASSEYVALADADAVWCTDWNAPPATDIPALFASGYDAPMRTDAPRFLAGPTPWRGAAPDVSAVGCAPGVGEPAG